MRPLWRSTATVRTRSVCPARIGTLSAAARQRRALESFEEVRTVAPVGSKRARQTKAPWPESTASSVPSARHRRAVPSVEAVAMRSPVGSKTAV